MTTSPPTTVSGKGPLSEPLFRSLWTASFVTNICTWMYNVAASWLMTSLSASSLMISLMQTASGLPIFILGLPAGALADLLDRRKIILWTQVFLVGVMGTLTGLTYLGLTTTSVLLLFTLLIGIGSALNSPAWQAIMPEITSPANVPAAVTLRGLSINLSRAIGPALGGVVIAASGVPVVFLITSVSFLTILWAVYRWQRPVTVSTLPPEPLGWSIVGGLRYVQYAPDFQRLLVRTVVYSTFASVFFALLPSIARYRLHLGPTQYSLLWGCMGVGAIVGSALMKRLRARLGNNDQLLAGSLAMAGAVMGLALTENLWACCGLMVVAGMSWITGTSVLNLVAQNLSPGWVRARLLAVYLMLFQGGIALASAGWGALTDQIGLDKTLWVIGLGMAIATGAFHRVRLSDERLSDSPPSADVAEPAVADPPGLAPSGGANRPLRVWMRYQADPQHQPQLLTALQQAGIVYRRAGALEWQVYRDLDHSDQFVASYCAYSWADYERIRQHQSQADRKVMQPLQYFRTNDATILRWELLPETPTS